MKIFIGCDPAGLDYKKEIIELLKSSEHDVMDIQDNSDMQDYPDVAKQICTSVLEENNSKGILICGTGMGMCLAANKIKGIRATLCHDNYSAQKSRSSNDANILTLGALTMGVEQVKAVVTTWVQDYTLNPNSAKKVAKLMTFEN